MIELSPALKQYIDEETRRQGHRMAEGYRLLAAMLKKDYVFTEADSHVGDTITLRLPQRYR